ncbi:MAG: hypothetical protein K6F46_07530 [Desulfovibrio sp.]|nr:hypothetical protein [Desulfovibrio sp.]
MRTLIVQALYVLLVLTLCLSALPARADIALPPGLMKPYEMGTKLEVTCNRAGRTLTIYLHTPGPCDYTIALREEGGKYLVEPRSGSLQRFGSQTCSLRMDLPALKPGESARYHFTAKGRLFNYKKVPVAGNEDEGRLAAMGRNMRVRSGLADPNEFRYELKDKNGKAFDFDIPLVVTGGEGGDCSVIFKGKSVR